MPNQRPSHHEPGPAPADGESEALAAPRSIRTVFVVAGPVLALVTYLLLAPGIVHGSVPESARRAAVVLVLMAAWWLTEAVPLAVTSLIPLVAFPLLGVMPLKEAAAPFADRIIFLFLGGFLIALAMERWNLHRRIALTTVLMVGTRPSTLVLGFMIATATLSMWMSNTATAVMMLPIGISIIKLVEDRTGAKAGNFGIALVLGIGYAASIGGVATPIGTPPNAILLAYLDKTYDIGISFVDWAMIGVPFVVVFVPLAWLIIAKLVYPVRLKEIPGGAALVRDELRSLGRVSRGERTVLVVFLCAVAGWMLREPLIAGVPSLKPLLKNAIDDTTVAIAAAIALFAIPVDRRRGVFAMDWATARRMPFDVLLLFGGGLSLAAGVQAGGLDKVFATQVSGLGGLPHWLILVVIIVLSVFLSEITSNITQANLFFPILGILAVGFGIDPLLLLVPCCFALSCAFMMPMGTAPNALVFGSGYVTIRHMARVGLCLNILSIVLCSLLPFTGVPWALGAKTDGVPEWAVPKRAPVETPKPGNKG